mgnify:CR=1
MGLTLLKCTFHEEDSPNPLPLRKKVDKEELSHGKREGYTYLILCTISGVAAGLQNTG